MTRTLSKQLRNRLITMTIVPSDPEVHLVLPACIHLCHHYPGHRVSFKLSFYVILSDNLSISSSCCSCFLWFSIPTNYCRWFCSSTNAFRWISSTICSWLWIRLPTSATICSNAQFISSNGFWFQRFWCAINELDKF